MGALRAEDERVCSAAEQRTAEIDDDFDWKRDPKKKVRNIPLEEQNWRSTGRETKTSATLEFHIIDKEF